MGTLLLVLVGMIVALSVLGIVQSRYERSVHRIPLNGPVSSPADWLPEAMEQATKGGMLRWAQEISPVLDDDGALIGFRGVLRSTKGDTILVDVPDFPPGDHTADPVVAEVVIDVYTVSSLKGEAWFGIPALHVRRRWRRARSQIRKHARRSMQHR